MAGAGDDARYDDPPEAVPAQRARVVIVIARVPQMMRWGLIPPLVEGQQASILHDQRTVGGFRDQACVPRRLEMEPALPRGHRRLLRMEEAEDELWRCSSRAPTHR